MLELDFVGLRDYDNSMARLLSRKKTLRKTNPYAHIDWKKAEALFQNPPPFTSHEKQSSITVQKILQKLAHVGDLGFLFLFNADKPGIEGVILGETSRGNWRTKQVIDRFIKQRYVTIHEHDDGRCTVKITKIGMVRALTYQLNTMQLRKQKTWDRKWRVIIFDIPNKYRRTRDIFRMRLIQIGLYRLQESVYVSPYPCFDEVEFLRELYGVSFTVRYLLVERIEDSGTLLRHFSLT